jgi:hypothetical protein
VGFPLPICPVFRAEVIAIWLDDVDDRLELKDLPGAEASWREAAKLLIKMEPGTCPQSLEDRVVDYRVKLDKLI